MVAGITSLFAVFFLADIKEGKPAFSLAVLLAFFTFAGLIDNILSSEATFPNWRDQVALNNQMTEDSVAVLETTVVTWPCECCSARALRRLGCLCASSELNALHDELSSPIVEPEADQDQGPQVEVVVE